MTNNIIVSIVIPCLNEEKTIGQVIKNAFEGLSIANIKGEIIVLDSSIDNSPKIAKELGAQVITTTKSGLGQAYIEAIPHINGKYVVMGDADCTYDFREINKFIAKLEQNFDYVTGTRIKGNIEKGAMPVLHRYFGIPLTTWILNCLVGSNFSDIHCGLRALTYESLKKMDIKSNSWEYASEMVIKAKLLKLKSTEVPIHFYKDKEGRQSHHKRSGWFSPWKAGLLNLKVMFLHVPNKLIVNPGIIFLLIGLLLICMQVNGPVTIERFTLSTSSMLIGLTLSVLGFSSIQIGFLVELFSDLNKFVENKITKFIRKYFAYIQGICSGLLLFLVGLILVFTLIYKWYAQSYSLNNLPWYFILGLLLITLGFQTFLFTLAYLAFSLSEIKKNDKT